ncbi:MAG: class II aldolase/adducin family protein [Deltaproteobacteria bacterium]|nr:class II aldolase/adducin family protein [Candidatus Zymogenaceae bacterium]
MTKYKEDRRAIIDAALWLQGQGYFGPELATAGNVSKRIENEALIAITPSGRPYQELKTDDIAVLDMEGALVSGNFPPSVELGLHLGVYAARADVQAVVHTHQPYASILGLLDEAIPPLFDDITMALGGEVEVIPYALSGSAELAELTAKATKSGRHAFLMKNHGAVCLGKSLDKAVKNAALLEKLAHVYYHALASGKKVFPLPEETATMLAEAGRTKEGI